MTSEQKKRWLLLQAFTQADEKCGPLLQKTAEVDDLLLELEQELTKYQIEKVYKITGAYCAMADSIAKSACKYMIFRSEIE